MAGTKKQIIRRRRLFGAPWHWEVKRPSSRLKWPRRQTKPSLATEKG